MNLKLLLRLDRALRQATEQAECLKDLLKLVKYKQDSLSLPISTEKTQVGQYIII